MRYYKLSNGKVGEVAEQDEALFLKSVAEHGLTCHEISLMQMEATVLTPEQMYKYVLGGKNNIVDKRGDYLCQSLR